MTYIILVVQMVSKTKFVGEVIKMEKEVTVKIPRWFTKKNPIISGRIEGNYIVVSGHIVRETEKAILFECELFDAWLPKSIIDIIHHD